MAAMKKIGAYTTIMVFALMAAFSYVFAKEDTANLTFQKTVISKKEKTYAYTIKKDEWLFKVLKREFDVSNEDVFKLFREVKEMNPQIKNFDILFPGQKILLPKKEKLEPIAELSGSDDSPQEKNNQQARQYTIKTGESISSIIQKELRASYNEIYRILEEVRKLNPTIKDINRVYPGQHIYLPIAGVQSQPKSSDEPSRTKNDSEGLLLRPEQQLALIKRVLERTGETVVTDGDFYIPLPPSGQITVNCEKVPIIELEDGNTIFLDFSDQIPQKLKDVIESRWSKYSFVNSSKSGTSISALNKITSISKSFSLEKLEAYKVIGDNPRIKIFVDWLLSKREESSREPMVFGINLKQDSGILLPGAMKQYARDNGFEIIEVTKENGTGRDESLNEREVPVLNGYTQKEMIKSLLLMLGYRPVEKTEIQVFDMQNDGFDLSVTADLLLASEAGDIVITFEDMSEQFFDVLKSKRIDAVYLSEEREKRQNIETVLMKLRIPYQYKEYDFSFAQNENENKDARIIMDALKIEGGEGSFYLVDYEVDKKINSLLYDTWKVRVVRY